MNRITNADLEQALRVLNTLTKSPMEPWIREGGKSKAQVGNYHLDESNGGVAVERMVGESGGVKTIIPRGTKREVYNRLMSYIAGMESAQ